MARTSKEVIRNVRCSVLGYLAERTKDRKGANVSHREIERALGYSSARVRRACRQLAEEGYLQYGPCFAEDGGQRPNAYTVTRKGRTLVREYEKAMESEARESEMCEAVGRAS